MVDPSNECIDHELLHPYCAVAGPSKIQNRSGLDAGKLQGWTTPPQKNRCFKHALSIGAPQP
eukprot:1150936-Pelagomonas_calceolata.AAC.1